jgi:hypothetical protein
MRKLMLAFALAVNVAAVPAATIAIVPSAPSITAGVTFTADINISGVVDLYAFQFDVSFTPGVLTATAVSDGMFLNSGGFFPGFTDNALGTITFIADSLVGPVPGVSGSGTLATIHFLAAGAGTSPITLSNLILLDSTLADIDIFATPTNATVAVVPEPTSTLLALAGLALWHVGRRMEKTSGEC